MGKVTNLRPNLEELCQEYDALVVIGVSEDQIQVVSNLEDPDIQKHLTQTEVKQVFNIQNSLKHMDAIFERVFGSS